MVVSSRRDTGGIQAPAITIAAHSWRDNSTVLPNIEQKCKSRASNQTVTDCIIEKTFNRTDFIYDVYLGYPSIKKFDMNFTEDFTVSSAGRMYTFLLQNKITDNYRKHYLDLRLNKWFINTVMVHDPKFFILNLNPFGLPTIEAVLRANSNNVYYQLILTEVEELDLPEDPCNTDPDYNFQACVRESLSSQVGCRTKWDRWSHQDIPLCTELVQFR